MVGNTEAHLQSALRAAVNDVGRMLRGIRLAGRDGLPIDPAAAAGAIGPLTQAVKLVEGHVDELRGLDGLSVEGEDICDAADAAVTRFFELDAELAYRVDSTS
jgi:hypothetical protein